MTPYQYRGYQVEQVGDGLAASRPGVEGFALFESDAAKLERLIDFDLRQVSAGPLIRCPGCPLEACECLP